MVLSAGVSFRIRAIACCILPSPLLSLFLLLGIDIILVDTNSQK